MTSCARRRLGGDEFAILVGPTTAAADITRARWALMETVGAPNDLDGHQVVVGASVGIALAPADGDTPGVLMKNADLALYRAKFEGGGVPPMRCIPIAEETG